MELVYLKNCTHNNLEASEFYFSKNYHLAFDDTTLLNYTKTNHKNIFVQMYTIIKKNLYICSENN